MRVACLLAILWVLASPLSAEAAGPWRAKVVDAQTGQPLAGVVVLAYWLRLYPSLGGWAGAEFHASEEVVTGADGRFLIHSRWAYTIPLVIKVSGPELKIFKPGYGEWRLQRSEEGEKFTKGEEVMIEMPPLRTREERLKLYGSIGWAPVVPPERTIRLREALDDERAHLGFRN